MASDNPKIDDIYLAALEKAEGEERGAYLDEVCGSDSALRARVERLLSVQPKVGSFLESAAPGFNISATIDQPITEKPGSQIGPYKLLQQIGEGGMGVVYMAEQTEPVQRKVALKVIKPGMDSRQVIARFEAERQALAMMDHVNIARVLDAGATDQGRPYFVMELVHGVPITKYCDDNRLTPRQRLELFVPVCQAIQHAHQKGIIHRDIKPSNVMVTLYDGKPVPKVIDFGVAKATERKLTERTLFTQYGTLVGTLEYMSPEQAEMSALGVDTRSDIFSLGVLLYELLTGSTPLSHKRMKEAAYAEILRLIKEEEPPKPSTRLSESGEVLASISASRQMEPAKLTRLVRGELDWIVMKTLEKDRNRRYETANAFAADVRRYLDDEPVEACPPSDLYRLRKFVRRNKAALIMTSVIGVALLVAVGSLGWSVRDRAARYSRIGAQADLILGEVEQLEKEQQWPEALSAARRAESLTAGEADAATKERVRYALEDLLMVAELAVIRLREEQGELIEEEELIDVGSNSRLYAAAFREFGMNIETLPAEESAARLRAHPAVAIALAAALDDWARTCRLKDHDQSKKLWALAAAVDSDPWRVSVRQASSAMDIESLLKLASAPDTVHQPPQSQLLLASSLRRSDRLEQALTLLERASEINPGDFWIHFSLGSYSRTIHPARLEAAVRHGIAARALRPRSVATWINLGLAYYDQENLDEAIACLTKAIELDPTQAVSYSNLGITLHALKKTDEAITALRKAIELKPEFASAHNNLGVLLLGQKKLDEAIAASRKAIELDPESPRAYSNLGNALRDQGKYDEAVAAYRKSIELQPKRPLVIIHLGNLLRYQGKLDEAIDCYNKVIELYPKLATVHHNLGLVLYQQKKLPEAIEAYRKEIELNPKSFQAYIDLGDAQRDNGDVEEAIDICHKAVELDPKQPSAYERLGYALAIKKDFEGAIVAYRTAIELRPNAAWTHIQLGDALRETGNIDGMVVAYRKAIRLEPNNAQAHYNFGKALQSQNKLDEAVTAYSKAIEIDPKLDSIHITRGEALCRTGRFREALVDYELATELAPDDLKAWYEAAALYLYIGDVERYRRACREMLDRFEQHTAGNASIPEMTAKTCALAPNAVPDFARVERLAQRAVTGTEKHGWYRNFVLAKGLTDYRGGHHERALEWLERFAPKPGGNVWDATAFAALSMAHHRLGHAEQARAALLSAGALLVKKKPDAQLFDWLHCEILYREAEGLMGPVTPQESAAEAPVDENLAPSPKK